jgi:hypothetical protein
LSDAAPRQSHQGHSSSPIRSATATPARGWPNLRVVATPQPLARIDHTAGLGRVCCAVHWCHLPVAFGLGKLLSRRPAKSGQVSAQPAPCCATGTLQCDAASHSPLLLSDSSLLRYSGATCRLAATAFRPAGSAALSNEESSRQHCSAPIKEKRHWLRSRLICCRWAIFLPSPSSSLLSRKLVPASSTSGSSSCTNWWRSFRPTRGHSEQARDPTPLIHWPRITISSALPCEETASCAVPPPQSEYALSSFVLSARFTYASGPASLHIIASPDCHSIHTCTNLCLIQSVREREYGEHARIRIRSGPSTKG